MSKKSKTTTEPTATTGTETDAPTAPQQGKQQYLPAAELWSRAIAQLQRDTIVSHAQVENWLRPARLAVMELPSGHSLAAAIQTHSTYAADFIRDHWHAEIRACLERLTGKQVILFVRNTRPPTMPPVGPDGGNGPDAA